MKTNLNYDFILSFLCILSLLLGIFTLVDSNNKFVIKILESNSKVDLECKKGCAWSKLNFSCLANDCKSKIDQFGMHLKNNNRKDSDLANFIIEIEKEKDEYKLSCLKGCNWKNLRATLKSETKYLEVTKEGITLHQ